ncbi:unnamed protein product, partial [Nesidiocoris tenuis]
MRALKILVVSASAASLVRLRGECQANSDQGCPGHCVVYGFGGQGAWQTRPTRGSDNRRDSSVAPRARPRLPL